MENNILHKTSSEKVDDFFERLVGIYEFRTTYQGISLHQVESVLKAIGKYSNDTRDVVWCLLNNEFPSLFKNKSGYKLSDGASIAHIGSYVGILMRGRKKLDREGRDYWIKPLREIGAIEPYTYDSNSGFLSGHVIAKSSNSCYRLNQSFIDLLKAFGDEDYAEIFAKWISNDSKRTRLEIQAAAEEATKASMNGHPHKDLIDYSIKLYAQHFLPDYIVIYKDDSDGDRITAEEQALMDEHGILLELEDSFPDVILYNEKTNSLWFIEAVTSDGEVDEHKLMGLTQICKKSGKNYAGSTTTFLNWKDLAIRQKNNKNLAGTSKVWILEDPQKQFEVQFQ